MKTSMKARYYLMFTYLALFSLAEVASAKVLVAIIDPASNKVIAQWPTAPESLPHGLALDASNGRSSHRAPQTVTFEGAVGRGAGKGGAPCGPFFSSHRSLRGIAVTSRATG